MSKIKLYIDEDASREAFVSALRRAKIDCHRVTIYYEDGTKTIEKIQPKNDVIILDPDVKRYFPDSESVNSTLRDLIKLIPKN